jgi:hypothetical protein
MEQDLVSAFVVRAILIPDELERVVERLNGRFERSLDAAPPQAQLVDVALDFAQPALRTLQQQVRSTSASRTIIFASF